MTVDSIKGWFLLAFFFSAIAASHGHEPCEVSVLSNVDARGPDLTLSDLLEPGACQAVQRAAADVYLGALPRAGSTRVVEGDTVRRLLETVSGKWPPAGDVAWHVPPRILVRPSGTFSSCTEIAEKLGLSSIGRPDCGAAERVSRDASFVIMRRLWDPATRRRELVVRCTRPEDCVPFRLAFPEAHDSNANALGSSRETHGELAGLVRTFPSESGPQPRLVHRGAKAVLLWDEGGIRVAVPAVALDEGGQGDIVRARISGGGRVLRALVVGPGELKTEATGGREDRE
ncbi:MAG TPA: flagella basal body P-ring formation protein FlgA [Dongiaceae bacterium]|nr:flagella basal body P-ring formation protein FlgA [Dongiaceae bacterium]